MEPNRKEHRLSCISPGPTAEVEHPTAEVEHPTAEVEHHGVSAGVLNRTPRGGPGSTLGGAPEQLPAVVPKRWPRRQAGVTLIGFLILAGLFGVIGFAVIKLVPMYMRNLTLTAVLKEVSDELGGRSATPGAIRVALGKRFDIEGIELPPENVKITQMRDGYQVRIQYEARAHYLSDIWLLVTFDKQVDIRR